MSAAVVSTSVIGSAAMTIHRGRGSAAASAADLVAERPRVGEEQRRVEAEDHQAGQLLGVGVAACGRGSRRMPGTRPSVVWYGHQARRNTLRIDSADGDGDARQHAEQGDAEERGDRQQELGSAAAATAARVPGDVGQRQRRGDHDGGQRRLRQVPQQPGHEHEHQRRSPPRRRAR